MKEYGLGDAFLATTEEVTPGAIHVHAQCMASQDACPTCGSKLKPWGSKPQLFVGLPREGKEVFIHVDTRRYRCTNKNGCEKTCLQPLPGMSAKRRPRSARSVARPACPTSATAHPGQRW